MSPFEVEEAIVSVAKDYIKVRFSAISGSISNPLLSLL